MIYVKKRNFSRGFVSAFCAFTINKHSYDMSNFFDKKLSRLAAVLRERGFLKESDKVLLLSGDLILKNAASAGDAEKAEKLRAELRGITGEGVSHSPPLNPEPTSNVKPEASGPPPISLSKERPPSKGSLSETEDFDEGLLLKVNSKNKGAVERLQKALVRAGFDLPRFGVDGLFGRETKSAVIAFKEKAKSDGKYSGEIDDLVSEDTLELIESYPDKGSEEHGTGPRITKGDFTLYLGDSQMAWTLGNALMAAGSGEKIRLAKRSTRASHWATNAKLISLLEKGPTKIIISLGGNGTGGTEALISLISSYSKAPVIWSGTPPPVRKKGSNHKFQKSDESFLSRYDKRSSDNDFVRPLVEAKGWTFINPYKHIRFDKPQIIGGREIRSGYVCSKCDGIHMPSRVAKEYVSKIRGLL